MDILPNIGSLKAQAERALMIEKEEQSHEEYIQDKVMERKQALRTFWLGKGSLFELEFKRKMTEAELFEMMEMKDKTSKKQPWTYKDYFNIVRDRNAKS